MIVTFAIAAVVIFAASLSWFGAIRAAAAAMAVSRGTMEIMRDPGLDDLVRENAVRQASLRLAGACLSIVARSVLAIAASVLPVVAGSALGLVTTAQVFEFLSRWDVIVIMTVAMVAGYFAWARLWPSS